MSPATENLLHQHREVAAVAISSGTFFAVFILMAWVIA